MENLNQQNRFIYIYSKKNLKAEIEAPLDENKNCFEFTYTDLEDFKTKLHDALVNFKHTLEKEAAESNESQNLQHLQHLDNIIKFVKRLQDFKKVEFVIIKLINFSGISLRSLCCVVFNDKRYYYSKRQIFSVKFDSVNGVFIKTGQPEVIWDQAKAMEFREKNMKNNPHHQHHQHQNYRHATPDSEKTPCTSYDDFYKHYGNEERFVKLKKNS